MSIFDMFSSKPAAAQTQTQAPAQAPVAQAPAPGNPSLPGGMQSPEQIAAGSQVADSTGVPPALDPSIPNKEDTPLDKFAALWENDPKDKSSSVPASAKPLNQEQLQKAVAKIDFSKSITSEQLAAITQGGEGAAQAFAQAINSVAQQAMTQSTLVSNKLNEHKLEQVRKEFTDQLPGLLRSQATSNHLKETNPLFNNPAVAPVVKATQQQLLAKYPNATQQEIATMTNDFIVAMGSAFAPAPKETDATPSEPDFSNFLD